MNDSRTPPALPAASADQDPAHDHHGGLAADLDRLQRLGRRRVLFGAAGLAGATLLTAWGCGGGGDSASTSSSSDTSTGTGSTTGTGSSSGSSDSGSCSVAAEETAGPYPGDGSNSAPSGVSNALALSGIVRSDIRPSFGDMSGTAEGVETALEITLVNVNDSCAALDGYAIYVWHCDRDGEYSLYGAEDRNYLRGVQATDSSGKVTFTTIFPACYSGRMPHIHVEVYRSTTTATSYTNKLKTTQIAIPTDVCETVYETATGYSASVANLARISFATDMVFADGTSTEMSTATGSVAAGYTIAVTLGVSV